MPVKQLPAVNHQIVKIQQPLPVQQPFIFLKNSPELLVRAALGIVMIKGNSPVLHRADLPAHRLDEIIFIIHIHGGFLDQPPEDAQPLLLSGDIGGGDAVGLPENSVKNPVKGSEGHLSGRLARQL